MPLLSVSPTTAQVEGVSRTTLLNRFLRETGLGMYGTATTGGSGIINDTVNLKSSQFTTSDWVGGWGRISYDAGAAAAAPENEHFPITTYDPTTNGRITVSPVFSADPVVGDKYQLWRYPNPTVVKDFLDQCLTNDIYNPCWSMLSEIPDYDMEANNITDWTASNATVTKITGTEPAILGKRWLSVVSTSASGYARTATMTVEPGKKYHISAIALPSAAATTAQLEVYDITNSASIDSKTSLRQYPTRIAFDINIPSTCYQIQIRLITQENAKTVLWDEVVFYAVDSSSIALPWWVKNKNQVRGIFELRQNQVAANIYDAELLGRPTNKYTIQDNAFGRGQLRLVNLAGSGISTPLFIFGIRNEVAYANDNTDIKRVDENLLFACLAYRVFSYLRQQPNSGVLDTAWVRAQTAEYKRDYDNLLRVQSERLEQIIESAGPSGYYNDVRFNSYG